ncbi:MAG: ATP synthase F1 subunit gamma, partial [Armatimonadetes bacterium]|nr:ATP synthase F1 subunit gamma [Armatimonadota bacterium]
MASLRDIRRRIQSVKSTRQITSAMKLVAGAKLRRATENAQAARPYQESLTRVLGRVAGAAQENDLPLLQRREQVRHVRLVVFTSDRGLCGGFNSNLLRDVERRVRELRARELEVSIVTVGKKARDYLGKRQYPVIHSHLDVDPPEFGQLAARLGAALRVAFVDGDVDEVQLVFNRFVSAMVQRPMCFTLLPLTVQSEGDEAAGDYAYEPDGASILATLLPLYVDTVLLQAMLETQAGEMAARMTAMDSATRNATEIIG